MYIHSYLPEPEVKLTTGRSRFFNSREKPLESHGG